MKIIGSVQDGELLLSASRTEVARLIGFYYLSNDVPKLEPGLEIKVSEMFEQLYALKSSEGKLREIADSMESFAALLRVKNPVITAALQGKEPNGQ